MPDAGLAQLGFFIEHQALSIRLSFVFYGVTGKTRASN